MQDYQLGTGKFMIMLINDYHFDYFDNRRHYKTPIHLFSEGHSHCYMCNDLAICDSIHALFAALTAYVLLKWIYNNKKYKDFSYLSDFQQMLLHYLPPICLSTFVLIKILYCSNILRMIVLNVVPVFGNSDCSNLLHQ